MKYSFAYFKSDLFAGLIVFLVALPLCLGIALASGAPLLSAVICGIIGGIVVGIISQSQVSVSGPAAGLTAIVLAAISSLGSFELFLTSVVLAGMIQLLLGLMKAGSLSNYIPSGVIEGMLAGIGVIIILKQIPHAIGFTDTVRSIHPGAVVVSFFSIAVLIAFRQIQLLQKIKMIPGELVAVVLSVLMNYFFSISESTFKIERLQLVQLPVIKTPAAFLSQLSFPDLSGFSNYRVWLTGLTIAVVAGIESLLCLEAAEKLDPLKRHANSNRELLAQGFGNMISGFMGGLPMASVIVRTSANVSSGAKTKLATILHGIFLFLAAALVPAFINQIPLASLAAILILIGFKLANPLLFIQRWKSGMNEFIPFMVTVVGVIFTDLLIGVTLGIIVSAILPLSSTKR